MPSKRTPSGEFRDIAHPINTEARQHIEKEVIEKYQEERNTDKESIET